MKKKYFESASINALVVILTIYVFGLPLNFYNILKHDYQKRLIDTYGFCEKESYGYMKKIKNKYFIDKNIQSINFDNYPRSSSVFFYNINYNFDENKIILLNYNSDDPSNRNYFNKNFSNYRILDNYKNKCLLIEKK